MTSRPVGRTTRRTAGPPGSRFRSRRSRASGAGLLAAATVLALAGAGSTAVAGPNAVAPNAAAGPKAVAGSNAGAGASATVGAAGAANGVPAELSETRRLSERRSLVVGDRAYAMGDESGLYPATGWHIRGEMGGFWTQPVKLLDGLWFGVDGAWLGKDVAAAKYTSGQGYQRIDYGGDVTVRRTDFVPDDVRATLVGVTLQSSTAKTVKLDVDAHSELMTSYPWGWTTPNAAEANLPDTGSYANGTLQFRDQGTPPVANAAPHDYTALVGSSLRPTSHALGANYRGPQDPAVICPADGTPPPRCDDSAFGKGTGGRAQLRRRPGGRSADHRLVRGRGLGPEQHRSPARVQQGTQQPREVAEGKDERPCGHRRDERSGPAW